MMNQTKHFKVRFDERVCSKTNRQQNIVDRAYYDGKDYTQVHNKRLSSYLRNKEMRNGLIAKAYRGQTYIFNNRSTVTVFPLPNRLRDLT